MLRKILVLTALLLVLPFSHALAEEDGSYPKVVMETTAGKITLELWPDQAPRTVANFLAYVRSGFYDGLIFHRVIPGFVIQAGGFGPGMVRRPPTMQPIVNEAANGLSNKRGTVAMARTSRINSATSQFFINLKDNPALDHQDNSAARYGYAVFGRVSDGFEVVTAIAAQETGISKGFRDVPVNDVVIERAYVEGETAPEENPSDWHFE